MNGIGIGWQTIVQVRFSLFTLHPINIVIIWYYFKLSLHISNFLGKNNHLNDENVDFNENKMQGDQPSAYNLTRESGNTKYKIFSTYINIYIYKNNYLKCGEKLFHLKL